MLFSVPILQNKNNMPTTTYDEENIAAFVRGDRKIVLKPFSLPELKSNDVLLAISSVGICGSDLKYWAYGASGRFKLDGKPMVIGHEASGIVKEVGKNVKHLNPGDRVAIEPGVPCKLCVLCKSGRYNLCKDVKFCGTPPTDGNLCKYYVHDADFCYKIPNSITSEEAAMLEPLSVAVYTCQRASISLGQSVVIFGAGPIGILCGLVAKTMGASKILTLDIDVHRLSVAKQLNSSDLTYLIAPDSKQSSSETASAIMEILNTDLGVHVSLECSGADKSLDIAIHVTMPGGVVTMVGRGSMNPNVPMVAAATKEVDIKGVFRYANNYSQAMSLVSSGAINVTKLITHRFNLQQSEEAFKTACDRHQRAIKVMINCD